MRYSPNGPQFVPPALSPVFVAVTDENVRFSVDNVFVESAARAFFLTSGAYAIVVFHGTSCEMTVDMSRFVSNGDLAQNYPTVRIGVDGVYGPTTQLSSATTRVGPTGLSNAWHVVRFEMDGRYGYDNVWDDPLVGCLIATGFILSPGATLGAATVPATRIRIDGDSIVEGVNILGVGQQFTAPSYPSVNRAHLAWPRLLADALGMDLTQLGYAGQAWHPNGLGNVPQYGSAVSNYFQNHSRLVSGLLPNPPAIWIACFGANDVGTVRALVAATIPVMRAQAGPNCIICITVEPSGAHRDDVMGGVADYLTATPTDTKTHYLSVPNLVFTTTDGIHPDAPGHIAIEAAFANALADIPTSNILAMGNGGVFGPSVWLDPRVGVTVSAGNATAWQDRVSSDVFVPDAATAYTASHANFGNTPALDIQGANVVGPAGTLDSTNGFTLITVLDQTATPGAACLAVEFDSTVDNKRHVIYSRLNSANWGGFWGSGEASSGQGLLPNNAVTCLSAKYSATQLISLRKNGVTVPAVGNVGGVVLPLQISFSGALHAYQSHIIAYPFETIAEQDVIIAQALAALTTAVY